MAHKKPSPARTLANAPHVIWAVDGDGPQFRHSPDEVDFLAVAPRRLPHVLQLERPLLPGKAYVVRTGSDKCTSGHPFVDNGLGRCQIGGLDLIVLGTTDGSRIHFNTVHGDDEG